MTSDILSYFIDSDSDSSYGKDGSERHSFVCGEAIQVLNIVETACKKHIILHVFRK